MVHIRIYMYVHTEIYKQCTYKYMYAHMYTIHIYVCVYIYTPLFLQGHKQRYTYVYTRLRVKRDRTQPKPFRAPSFPGSRGLLTCRSNQTSSGTTVDSKEVEHVQTRKYHLYFCVKYIRYYMANVAPCLVQGAEKNK